MIFRAHLAARSSIELGAPNPVISVNLGASNSAQDQAVRCTSSATLSIGILAFYHSQYILMGSGSRIYTCFNSLFCKIFPTQFWERHLQYPSILTEKTSVLLQARNYLSLGGFRLVWRW